MKNWLKENLDPEQRLSEEEINKRVGHALKKFGEIGLKITEPEHDT